VADSGDWGADWEGTRRWQRSRLAEVTPLERLAWLESTKAFVAEAWRARNAADPTFCPPGDWWRSQRGGPRSGA
jgi:hypothetical protein